MDGPPIYEGYAMAVMGYVRYVRTTDVRRWGVHGECQKLGFCWQGGADVKAQEDWDRLNLDCPVTPEFEGCCAFTYVELPPADPS